jgi:homoserine kinase type II
MAVYTHIGAEDMATILSEFDVGELVSVKGIAEGVQNSNYLVDTTQARFILTVYEQQVDLADLPFFLALLDHLADKGCPVPSTIHNRSGGSTSLWNGKTLALIEFLPGVSVSYPTPAKARSVGTALAQMHLAAEDFSMSRVNSLGLDGWFDLAAKCGDDLDKVQRGLKKRVTDECAHLRAHWPHDLPKSVIHADLFPDNVLMNGDAVGGLIDFYFSCTDIRAWDLAVTHAAWAFSADGAHYDATIGDALTAGYESLLPLNAAEREAFPILARGACLRFLLTRAWDWMNTPADALVTRKDPIAFLRRLDHYAAS